MTQTRPYMCDPNLGLIFCFGNPYRGKIRTHLSAYKLNSWEFKDQVKQFFYRPSCKSVSETILIFFKHHFLFFFFFFCHTERECDELPNPEHGVVQMTGRLFNDKATYSCEIGYQLIGRDHRTCHATGSWSGVEPFCKQSGWYCYG